MKINYKHIRIMRRSMGMNQEQLGAALGFNGENVRKTINRWESGTREPRAENLKKLIELYVKNCAKKAIEIVEKKQPTEVNLTSYSSQEDYIKLTGYEFPIELHNAVNNYVAQILNKNKIRVIFTEVSEKDYFDWLIKKELPNSPEARALFVASFNKFI